MCGDMARGGRRVSVPIVLQVYGKAKQALAGTISDSHLSVFEAYQPFIINSLDDIEGRFKGWSQVQPGSEVLTLAINKVEKKLKDLELTL